MFVAISRASRRRLARPMATCAVAALTALAAAGAARAQTDPPARSLPYSESFASLTPGTQTVLPAGWAAWQVGSAASAAYATSPATADVPLTASGDAASDVGAAYNYLDKPGVLDSDSFDGALALAVNTSGLRNIVVGYDIMTLRNPYDGAANTRISLTTLQYRVGTSGSFTTLDAAAYWNDTTPQTSGTTGANVQARSITLPAECNDQPVVQLRWVSRDSTGAGSRPGIALDDVSVSGVPDTWTITASAGANGSITPPGVTTVSSGGSQAYTITPDPGYAVLDVLVDGGSVGAVSGWSFTNVTADHTIDASFTAGPATVDVGSPAAPATTVNPTVSVPVTLSRVSTTPLLGFTVDVTLSAGLTAGTGDFALGGFLAASGASATLQVVDHGGGHFTVDGVTLGEPCGSSATSGTLFTIAVGSTLAGGTGTVTLDAVGLRDCSNATLGSAIGTAGTVTVDRSTPVVAVTSPNGGESWLGGSTHDITWTATDPEGIAANGIALELSTDDGASWTSIATGQPATGSFGWTVPAAASAGARVRVTALDVNANPGSDASDAAFTIRGATTTSVNGTPNPSTFGASVAFAATVAVVAPGAGTPGGTVEFRDGATSLGSAPLAGGSASLSTSALAAGSHSITAVYSGDASFGGSTSSALTQVVDAAGTSVALAAAPDPGVFQDAETLTATLSGAGDPGGSIEFFDGAASLGTAPVSGTTAALVTSSLAVGTHALTAHYPGDANHAPATSAPVSLEIQARIVATASANGSLAPAGTLLVSLGATPSFTFAADPGYHVASVTVDGAGAPLASPYTFAPVSANHTLDVQFAANPAVPAITSLAASPVRTGNDADGTTKIALTWTPVPAGSTVEVWRRGFGNYPDYDDGATPGSEPPPPAAYPPAGWTLTAVASPGDTDEPPARDFWYYVAFVRDAFGTVSPVSNRTGGTLDYHLGDVSNGITVGAGDNKVDASDLSLLGAHYGLTGAAVAPWHDLDVGPTSDLSVGARPTTDHRIDFEDLVMFALNWFPAASAPQAHARPAAAAADAVTLSAPDRVSPGEEVAVRVGFTGTGRVLGLSLQLAWDPAVVEPVSYAAGAAVLAQGGAVFSPAAGAVDGASFAGAGQGLAGDGEFATLTFRALAAGAPRFAFARADARGSRNERVALSSAVLAPPPGTWVTAFAPAMPSPFTGSTTLRFSLASGGRAELALYSVDGRRVRTLATGTREAGEYRIAWDGRDDAGRPLAAGVYYAKLVTSRGRFTRVVTMLR